MARLRAVVTSQPAGLAGSPSRGQRSAVMANASAAASSASSMSPRTPTRVASTRPHWSRKTSSSTPELLLEHRTDLDRNCEIELLQLGGDGKGAVEVVRVDEDQAAEELLAVNERPVGEQRLSCLETDGGGRVSRLETHPARH